jgi:hypothetical protein
MAVHHPLDRFTGIHQKVEAVGHLEGVRRASPSAISIRARAIPADDLDPRMGLQPGNECVRFAIRQ